MDKIDYLVIIELLTHKKDRTESSSTLTKGVLRSRSFVCNTYILGWDVWGPVAPRTLLFHLFLAILPTASVKPVANVIEVGATHI